MSLSSQIEGARGDAAKLERLFRQALSAGNESVFEVAIRRCAEEHPEDILITAWACRLDIESPALVEEPKSQSAKQSQIRQWWVAVASSATLGVLYALFARGKPPVPVPIVADPLFWIGWGPLTALGILSYLSIVDNSERSLYRYAGPAVAVLSIGMYAAAIAWNRTDHIPILVALHLPVVAWAAIGVGLCAGNPDHARQGHAFLLKSMEIVLTGGVYFGAGVVSLGLTYSIFAVLGITLPGKYLLMAAAWGIGVIPILSVASVYDPTAAPAAQDWATGFAHILRILTRLLLPLAIGVLAIYVFWFIPAYFWRPFREREVLIVYNATIMAILVLMTIVVAGPDDERSVRQDTVLHYAVLALGVLTLLLNVYALSAMLARTIRFGLSPNRYAFLGWNIVTLAILVAIVIPLSRIQSGEWVRVLRKTLCPPFDSRDRLGIVGTCGAAAIVRLGR